MNRLHAINRIITFLALMNLSSLLAQRDSCFAGPVSTVPIVGMPWFPAISPNGRCIAVSANSDVSLFSLNSKKCTIDPKVRATVSVPNPGGLAFSPDGTCLVVASLDADALYVFCVNEHACTIKQTQKIKFPLRSSPFNVAFSPNGKNVAVALLQSSEIALFEVDKRKCKLGEAPLQTLEAQGNGPLGISYSPCGTCLAWSNFYSHTLTLAKVDPLNGKVIICQTQSTDGEFPQELVFSPCNKCFAVIHCGGFDDAGTVSIFSFNALNSTAVPVQTRVPTGKYSTGGSYSKDGRCLFVTNSHAHTISSFSVNKNTHCIELVETIEADNPDRMSRHESCFVFTGFNSRKVNAFGLECHQSSANKVKPKAKEVAVQSPADQLSHLPMRR